MAAKSDIIDKKALEESLKEITSSIEKSFSSSLANVTKGITTALFLIARPSIVTINTNNAEKNIKKLEREIKILDSAIEKKRSVGLDTKKEEKSLAILKEKQKYSAMTAKETKEEIKLLKDKKTVLESFDTINIQTTGIDAANKELKKLNNKLKQFKTDGKDTAKVEFNITEAEKELKKLNTELNKFKTGGEKKAKVEFNITEAEKKLKKLKTQLEETTGVEREINVKTEHIDTATDDIDTLKEGLKKLGVDAYDIKLGISDADAQTKLDAVNKELKNAERERKIKLTMVGFEIFMQAFEQIDKAFRAAVGMGNAAIDFMNQKTQNEIDELGEKYETEQALLDEKYETDVDKLGANLETKQGMLDELDKRDAERQAFADELAATRSTEDRARLEDKLKGYEGDAEKRILLNGEIATAEKTLLSEKDVAETKYNADKTDKEKTYLTNKAEMEKKQAVAAKAMKVTEAVIGMASAVLAATISGLTAPFPLSLVMVPLLVGMAIATGAVQIATIVATPIPEVPSFSSGGIVSGNNDHLYPNIPKSKNRDDRTLAWLSEGEMVLTRNQTEMYDNIIARDTFNSVNNSNVNHITNDIKIYTDNKTNTKLLAKQIVLEISRGYS